MVRTAIPGGKLTAEQMLAEIDLGDDLANGSVRLTTRQGIQHHGLSRVTSRQRFRRSTKFS